MSSITYCVTGSEATPDRLTACTETRLLPGDNATVADQLPVPAAGCQAFVPTATHTFATPARSEAVPLTVMTGS